MLYSGARKEKEDHARYCPRATPLSCALCYFFATTAVAQKSGGMLKFFHRDSPASMSIHEEATISTVGPMMGVFNNLVLFNQHEKQNRLEFDRARSRRELDVERGRHAAQLSAAPRRQMA